MSVTRTRLVPDDEALAHGEQGMARARAAGDLATVAAIQTSMGIGHAVAGRPMQALAHHETALENDRVAGSRNGMVNVRLSLAVVEEAFGCLDNARALRLQAVQDGREIGARRLEAMALANLSGGLCDIGHSQDGDDCAQKDLKVCLGAGDTRAAAVAHRGTQMSAHALGLWPQALDHDHAARARFTDHGHQEHAWVATGLLARPPVGDRRC